MEQINSFLLSYIDTGNIFAPMLFITFHILRPFVFLPVVLIFISGGLLFGSIAGTLYSVIGITLSSVLFYGVISLMPKTSNKFAHYREKLARNHITFTPSQITILKIIPFIHFHFLSLCLIDMSTSFKDYTKLSLFSSVPSAFIYTSIGRSISSLSPFYTLLFLIALLFLIYLLRKRNENIKWVDFFQMST